ncbi:phage portal protein [Staphylococcus equorum]|uniref:phage portal protein n=1 Tax=Staphylococcus equorum TaxID=246432 RepID=UPI0020CC5D81|nr:phage portal protein [Staphylococcus equorum]MEB7746279.1 phage portal protein [Staphylococcus equorum]UTT57457.1 phage portal protein [Staphylococcus equorum]UTT57459.1 phage portal protein [Staphylococcus equorum]
MKTKFSPHANADLLTVNADEVVEDYTKLQNLVNTHKMEQATRLNMLEQYFLSDNTGILSGQRRKDAEKADHRAVHNFAKYISQFIVGYLTGNPLTFTHDDESTQQAIYDLNDANDADAVNSDIALDLSIYGRAYEIVFRDEDEQDRFLTLDPKNTFVVYNHDIDKKIIAGVRYYDSVDAEGIKTNHIEVYTATHLHSFVIRKGELESTEAVEHHYNDVPIIEYLNNKFKQGDFENVLSLIDLYDSAQSDTANYMTDTNDAMLAVVGNVEMDGEDAQKFKDANMIHVKPEMNANGGEGKADVKYIYKQYDVQGSEAYKTRLQNDIHKFTNTPDLTDENFTGTQSGEAMKYKLFGLEQARAVKERLFKKGLTKRYKLLFNNLNILGTKTHDHEEIDIAFTPNLPKSMKDNVEVVNLLAGTVSEKTRLGLLDFIDDPDAEIERLQQEEDEQLTRADNREYSFDDEPKE